MSLISLLVALVIIGVALYLLSLIPMDATVRRVIYAVAIAAVVIWSITHLLPAGALR